MFPGSCELSLKPHYPLDVGKATFGSPLPKMPSFQKVFKRVPMRTRYVGQTNNDNLQVANCQTQRVAVRGCTEQKGEGEGLAVLSHFFT